MSITVPALQLLPRLAGILSLFKPLAIVLPPFPERHSAKMRLMISASSETINISPSTLEYPYGAVPT